MEECIICRAKSEYQLDSKQFCSLPHYYEYREKNERSGSAKQDKTGKSKKGSGRVRQGKRKTKKRK